MSVKRKGKIDQKKREKVMNYNQRVFETPIYDTR